jgi:hypothetical protein
VCLQQRLEQRIAAKTAFLQTIKETLRNEVSRPPSDAPCWTAGLLECWQGATGAVPRSLHSL